jgi:ubiquinone/menaquinone biosynthesis C-methylase UbiE
MLKRHNLALKMICEVGCGAGEILRLLQQEMDPTCLFWGYDISPQAYEFCKGKENDRLHYKLY